MKRRPIPSRLSVGSKMLALGAVLGWASVHAIPLLVRAGVAEHTANRLPFLGFSLGLALGAASAVSQSLSGVISYALLVPVCGGVFWFFGVLLGGLLVGFGVAPSTADYVPLIAFCFGVALALLPGVAVGSDTVSRWLARARKLGRKRGEP